MRALITVLDEAYVRTGKSKVGVWDAPAKKVASKPGRTSAMTIDEARQAFLWAFKHVDGASTANNPRALKEFVAYAAYSAGYEGDDYAKALRQFEPFAKSVGVNLRAEFDNGASDR